MSSFELLKTLCCNKPYSSFKDLPIGDYFVHKFDLVDTKYGKRLRADLGDKVVFLPARFAANITIEAVAELNRTRTILTFMGKDPAQNNKVKIDFKTVEELAMNFNPEDFVNTL